MNKTIYTAIYGGYDFLKEPEVVTPGWKYLCYSDRPQESKTWETIIRPPQFGPVKSSRAIKILHRKFTPPGLSVWADASMRVKGNLDDLLLRYHHGDFVIPLHPDRSCIYEEARACINLQKDRPDIISNQVHGYRLDGFPPRAGLVASGVIIRSAPHRSFSDSWWHEVRTKSCRDQLSFPVIAKSTGLDYQVMPFAEVMSEFFTWHHEHPKTESSENKSRTPTNKIVGI